MPPTPSRGSGAPKVKVYSTAGAAEADRKSLLSHHERRLSGRTVCTWPFSIVAASQLLAVVEVLQFHSLDGSLDLFAAAVR